MTRSRLLAVLTAVLFSCAAAVPEADASKGQIRADLKEYAIALTSPEMRSGTVTFIARNAGGIAHELVVLKTDLAPDKLTLDAQTQKATEDGKQGALTDVAPGKSLNLRLDLPAGHYVLICNVPTHYQLGMRTELVVK